MSDYRNKQQSKTPRYRPVVKDLLAPEKERNPVIQWVCTTGQFKSVPCRLNSKKDPMSALPTSQIQCIDDDGAGDLCVGEDELCLWMICRIAQKTFDAEVIFTHWPEDYLTKENKVIKFFLPRDHPQLSELEAYLIKALAILRQACVASLPSENGWCADVDISLYRYSGISGAYAFHGAANAVMSAGGLENAKDLVNHPDPVRVAKLAFEEGQKAALLTSRREARKESLFSRLATPPRC
jgi:hypothetical protein